MTQILTREELNMLGFDENGKSILGKVNNNNYHASAWESVKRPHAVKSASKRATTSLHFNLDDNYSKPITADKAAELQKMVGKFVCVRGIYGLIDAVHNDRLGFVQGSEDEWSSHVVPMNQVRVCTPMEYEIAKVCTDVWRSVESVSVRRFRICIRPLSGGTQR